MASIKAKDTFQGISLQILAKKWTAIVGPPQIGKSTILQLIQRFYEPKFGKITFDSVPIENIDLNLLRLEIAFIDSEPCILQDTVRNNLSYAHNGACD